MLPKGFKKEPFLESELIERLRKHEPVQEAEFDAIFPPFYQLQSLVHWSSIEVAREISSWLAPEVGKTIIDIGCGVGKLCVLLNILTGREIHGIEQRQNLVDIANRIILVNGLENIHIKQMNMLDLVWDQFDIYYLYNPFQEHIVDDEFGKINSDIEFDKKHYLHYTAEVYRQLRLAKAGKIFISFHGYGGPMPPLWMKTHSENFGSGELAMWIKGKA
jgi:SAM-dependent methyltransferase